MSAAGLQPRKTRHDYEPKAVRNVFKLAGDDPDRRHLEGCPDNECSRCWFALNKVPWQQKLPQDVSRPDEGSWLYGETRDDGVWGLKCRACARNNAANPFATGFSSANRLRLSIVYNHAKTKSHRQACAVSKGADRATWDLQAAPPESQFMTLLHAIRDGKSAGNKGVNGVGKRWKCRRMKFALAEAKRGQVRKALGEALVIALHQDGRQGRLAIRVSTCNAKLETFKGVLGSIDLTKQFSLDAIGMRNATLHIIQEICTPNAHVPFRKGSTEVDGKTLENTFDKIELFDTDAAADETLTGKLLRGIKRSNNEDQDFKAVFENLKIYNRDKPHGARRSRGTREWKVLHLLGARQTQEWFSTISAPHNGAYESAHTQM